MILYTENPNDSTKKNLLKLINKFNKAAGYKINIQDFPHGAVVNNLPANAGDTALSPGPGRSHMPRNN